MRVSGRLRFKSKVADWVFGIGAILAVWGCAAVFAQPATTRPAPSFIVGTWFQPVSSFPKWKARGCNTLIGIETEGGTVTAAAYVAAAHAAQLYVVGDDPACDFIHVGPDEPDGAGAMAPAVYRAKCDAARAANPGKLLFGNFDGWKAQWRPAADYVTYMAGLDIVGADYYPLNLSDGPAGTYLDRLNARIKYLKGLAGSKRFIAFIECGDQNLRVQPWANNATWGPPPALLMRGPTADEFHQEVAAMLAQNVWGIAYFPDRIGAFWESFDDTPNDVAAQMTTEGAAIVRVYKPAPWTPPTPPAPPPVKPPLTLTVSAPGYVPSQVILQPQP